MEISKYQSLDSHKVLDGTQARFVCNLKQLKSVLSIKAKRLVHPPVCLPFKYLHSVYLQYDVQIRSVDFHFSCSRCATIVLLFPTAPPASVATLYALNKDKTTRGQEGQLLWQYRQFGFTEVLLAEHGERPLGSKTLAFLSQIF